MAGLGLGFAGVFVLAAPEFGADLMSILEVLAAAVCYALGSIVVSRWLKDISPLLATGACLVVGAFVAPAVAVAAGVAFLSEPLTGTILIAFTLILSGSVLATGVSTRVGNESITTRRRIQKSLDTP